MHHILDLIEETSNKSIVDDFRAYMKKLEMCKKWLIHSDYCFDDNNKPNDVAVFTVIPYIIDYHEMKRIFDEYLPTDIKNRRSVSDETVSLLKSGAFFHFCFILNKKRKIFRSTEEVSEKDSIKSAIENSIKMIESWEAADENQSKYYNSHVKKFNALLQEMNKNSFNLKLIKNIMLVSLFSAYIGHLLTKESSAEIIGWFSDRDNITRSHDGIIFDMFHLNHHGLSGRDGVDMSKTQIAVGIPEEEAGTAMWYDSQNKLPDHIAGTLADWNVSENTVSKPKFTDLLSRCLVEKPQFAILKCTFTNDLFHCGRLTLTAAESNEP